MSQNFDEIADEWIGTDDEADYPDAEQDPEVDSSALTWDEETVRESHRDVARRSRRASGERLF
jgi:hypothetical protein